MRHNSLWFWQVTDPTVKTTTIYHPSGGVQPTNTANCHFQFRIPSSWSILSMCNLSPGDEVGKVRFGCSSWFRIDGNECAECWREPARSGSWLRMMRHSDHDGCCCWSHLAPHHANEQPRKSKLRLETDLSFCCTSVNDAYPLLRCKLPFLWRDNVQTCQLIYRLNLMQLTWVRKHFIMMSDSYKWVILVDETSKNNQLATNCIVS